MISGLVYNNKTVVVYQTKINFVIFGCDSTFEVLSRVRAVGSSSLWLGEGQRFESVTRNYLIINLKDTIMNLLTLSVKQIYFDEILAGKKTHEYREIRPTNAKKYITYLCGGKEYKADEELPEEGEIELKPIKYDAIKFLTGEYKGKRPYAIVEVKGAEASILTDEDGNDIVYEHQGEEYLAAQMDYTLGEVLEKHIDWLFNLKIIAESQEE